jgi:ferritin-like metal-binding protein YciE
VEKQALSIMQPQVNRLMHYPDLHQRLEAHIS